MYMRTNTYMFLVYQYICLCLIGERSKPSVGRWMENFVVPRMPIYVGIYMSVYIFICAVLTNECTEDFADST